MKAIILAAGKGTRLRPITNTTAKPLIKIVGKTIIEHNLENIYKSVDEIIIIVKYLKETFPKVLGDNYKGTKIRYIEQNEKKGTGGALMGLEEYIDDDILILNGDSIFEKNDLDKILNLKGYGILVKKVESPEKYGITEIDSDNNIIKMIEKPEDFIGNLANLGVYKFNKKFLEYIKNTPISIRGEYELIEALNVFASNFSLKAIEIEGNFIDIGYSWDILEANSYFLDKLENSDIKGKIEENVVIKGKIILEEGAILKSGTYIEGNVFIGKNTSIGPNCYIRGNSVFGENCHIGNACEIKNSNFGNNSKAGHLTYIGDSIIGNNVNFGAGFLVANLRHDNTNIKVIVKEKLIDTGLRKLGCIVGDNAKIGIGTRVYPGRIIETDSMTIPGEIIKK